MNQRRPVSRTLKVVSLLPVIVLFGVCVGWWQRFRQLKYSAVSGPTIKHAVPEDIEPEHLFTTASSETVAVRLLDGTFLTVDRVQEIPDRCRSPFDASFVRNSRTGGGSPRIEIADPDQPFQFADAIQPGLPFRQLVLAGLGPSTCFIYYQHGGAMYPSFCLAVMQYGKERVAWVGEARRKANGLRELRLQLSGGEFESTGTPTC